MHSRIRPRRRDRTYGIIFKHTKLLDDILPVFQNNRFALASFVVSFRFLAIRSTSSVIFLITTCVRVNAVSLRWCVLFVGGDYLQKNNTDLPSKLYILNYLHTYCHSLWFRTPAVLLHVKNTANAVLFPIGS